MPENTVSVARPGRWGNPYPVPLIERQIAVAMYRDLMSGFFSPAPLDGLAERDFHAVYAAKETWRKRFGYGVYPMLEAKRLLRGKNLACWCPLDQPCHADVLLELANAPSRDQAGER